MTCCEPQIGYLDDLLAEGEEEDEDGTLTLRYVKLISAKGVVRDAWGLLPGIRADVEDGYA